MATTMSDDTDPQPQQQVDESLYSRQLYVYGHEAQRKMQNSKILIIGLRGLGMETAKNVVLAGVKAVTLFDPEIVQTADLGANFYLKTSDIGKNTRAAASLPQLCTLNPYVDVDMINTAELSEEQIKQYTVVVLTDAAYYRAVEINDICRKHDIKFISASCEGLLLSIFVDNGKEHVITDPDGNQNLRGLISYIDNTNPLVITTSDESRHGLSTDMYITFEDVEGAMKSLNDLPPQKVKVISPYSFSIDVDGTQFKQFTGTRAYFNQTKMPFTETFKPLSELLSAANKQDYYVSDWMWEFSHYFSLCQALSNYRQANGGKYPTSNNREEVLKVFQDFATILKKEADVNVDDLSAAQKDKYFNLIRVASTSLSPMCAIGGGHVGQEVLKAVSGKFTPIKQFYFFHASEALPTNVGYETTDFAEYTPNEAEPTRYNDYIVTFGKDIQNKVQTQKVFLVGSGAIGCEMLKNWAMMGVATSSSSSDDATMNNNEDNKKKGSITITDMDTIEKSNLNRQFLFRAPDVGKLKSVAASDATRVMNPEINIIAQSLKVAEDTESTYDDKFWSGLSGVYTALDNVDARLYVDQRCVYYGLPLVDSGTLGTAGNTQVVVPYLTESYASTRDPPEAGIPICTLKNFPHKIEHTIQWARDVFEGDFKAAPEEANNWIKTPNYLSTLRQEQNTMIPRLQQIKQRLVEDKPSSFDDCILWARKRFDQEFNHKIRQLLHQFPADSMTTEGTPFWSGTKRAPQPIEFDADDQLHFDFVLNAALLYAFNYSLTGTEDVEKVKNVLATYQPTEWQPTGEKIAATEAEAKEMAEKVLCDADAEADAVAKTIPTPQQLAGVQLNGAEFEKDDDTNHHIAFITACSNLRARNYQIKEESAHMTKFIAGKIIPAIATTTALVTGLVCLEMYKLLQNKPIEAYRSSFVSLASNMFASSEPQPAAKTTTTFPNGKTWDWGLWDSLKVDLGKEPTLGEVIDFIKEEYGCNISCVILGNAMVWMDLYDGDAQQAECEKTLLSTLLKEKAGITLEPNQHWCTKAEFSLVDDDDEDISIPPCRIRVAGW